MTDRDDRAQPIQYQVLMGNIRLCEYERGADFSIPDRISKDGVDDAVHILWNFFDAKGTMMPRLIFAVVSSFSAPQA